MNIWILLSGVNAAMSVAAGAYGWHALEADTFFMMASQYQMWHALGMLGVGLLLNARPSRFLNTAGWCFQIGIALFSGTLYIAGAFAVVATGTAPFGGVLLILGWLTLGVAGARHLTHD